MSLKRWVHKYNVSDYEKDGWKICAEQTYEEFSESGAVQENIKNSGEIILMEKEK